MLVMLRKSGYVSLVMLVRLLVAVGLGFWQWRNFIKVQDSSEWFRTPSSAGVLWTTPPTWESFIWLSNSIFSWSSIARALARAFDATWGHLVPLYRVMAGLSGHCFRGSCFLSFTVLCQAPLLCYKKEWCWNFRRKLNSHLYKMVQAPA